jgi:serine protease
VAGVATLMKAVNPGLTPAAFDALLASGAITSDLGAPGRDDLFGHGLVDARRAVEAASQAAPGAPILVVTPTGLNFGPLQSATTFVIANGGGGTLTVTSVSDDQPWLSVSGSGLGTYTASVDRTGLADGTYTATITIQSSAGNAAIAVVMSVDSSAPGADAGFHYVLLVDPVSLATVAQAEATAVGGQYAFQLTDVPAGSYLLFAGSDSDNDSVICGTGEACGAYPTLASPERIELSGDRSDLAFVTGFLQTLGSAPLASGGEAPRAGLRRLRAKQPAR